MRYSSDNSVCAEGVIYLDTPQELAFMHELLGSGIHSIESSASLTNAIESFNTAEEGNKLLDDVCNVVSDLHRDIRANYADDFPISGLWNVPQEILQTRKSPLGSVADKCLVTVSFTDGRENYSFVWNEMYNVGFSADVANKVSKMLLGQSTVSKVMFEWGCFNVVRVK